MVDTDDVAARIPVNRHRVFLIVLPAIMLAFLFAPVLDDAIPNRLFTLFLMGVYSLSVFAGVWAFSPSRRIVGMGVAFFVLHAVGIVLSHAVEFGAESTFYLAIVSQAPLVILSLLVQVIYLAKAHKVMPSHLCSAVFAYILLGVFFSFLYVAVWAADDQAFRGIEPLPDHVDGTVNMVYTLQPVYSELVYFSFVTITTLGYGDIAPVGELARSIAIVEALVGQIFLVVFVAHLVSLNIVRRTSERAGS